MYLRMIQNTWCSRNSGLFNARCNTVSSESFVHTAKLTVLCLKLTLSDEEAPYS